MRASLAKKGLYGKKLKYAHSLIARSIFARYLEDRRIITREYFYKVGRRNEQWIKILDSDPETPFVHSEMASLLFPKVLGNLEFSLAFF